MDVYYAGYDSWDRKPSNSTDKDDVIILKGNNWDDFGFKTTFNASLYIGGKRVSGLEFVINILIDGCDDSDTYLHSLKSSGEWDGYFPIPEIDYVSLPSDIDFYVVLKNKLDIKDCAELLEIIKDAGYMTSRDNDSASEALIESPGFSKSLLRESGSYKAYVDGIGVIFGDEVPLVKDFVFNFRNRDGNLAPAEFSFNSTVLPYDINILIGPNGIGKSFLVKKMIENILRHGSSDTSSFDDKLIYSFDKRPNLKKIVLASYSPFEDFPTEMVRSRDGSGSEDLDYRYFGFREKTTEGIVFNSNLPKRDAASSIIDMIIEDNEMSYIEGRVEKISVALSHVVNSLGVEFVALKMKYFPTGKGLDRSVIDIEGEEYLIIDEDSWYVCDLDDPHWYFDLDAGVFFIKDGSLVEVSSGQALFSYSVIGIVGEIQNNSLIIIDEPELFLHPTFEINFISLLKEILVPFYSKAILATHSLTIVREVPSKCVHIMEETDLGLVINPPPFETFGGDMQRISTYVFGDGSVTKPFDSWLKNAMSKGDKPEVLLEKLGDQVSLEMRMKIKNYGGSHGF